MAQCEETEQSWPPQHPPGLRSSCDTKRMRSRHAAQNRRLYENSEFERLAVSLPIPRDISSQLLDKASVVRLTISCLKFYEFSQTGSPGWMLPESSSVEMFSPFYNDQHERSFASDTETKLGSKILEALDGFLLCLTTNATVLYVSETVSVGLGLSQIEMIGNPLTDYIHTADQGRFNSVISGLRNGSFREQQMCLRLKSTLSKRVSKDSMQSSVGHKVVQLFMAYRTSAAETGMGICLCGYPLPSAATADRRLDFNSFVITTQLDLLIHYMDPRGEEILGYGNGTPAPRGMSLYHLVHADDLAQLGHLHREGISFLLNPLLFTVVTYESLVMKLGGSASSYFRLLCCGGGAVWIHAFGIRIQKQKSRQQLNFLTICCSVLQERETSEILDVSQTSTEFKNNDVHPAEMYVDHQWPEHPHYIPPTYSAETVFYATQ